MLIRVGQLMIQSLTVAGFPHARDEEFEPALSGRKGNVGIAAILQEGNLHESAIIASQQSRCRQLNFIANRIGRECRGNAATGFEDGIEAIREGERGRGIGRFAKDRRRPRSSRLALVPRRVPAQHRVCHSSNPTRAIASRVRAAS